MCNLCELDYNQSCINLVKFQFIPLFLFFFIVPPHIFFVNKDDKYCHICMITN